MKVITIMAEHLGAYAWLKQEDDGTTLLGGNIAANSFGFEGSEFWVSPGLEQAFADWMDVFYCNCDDPDADWPAFNSRGIELSRRLKEQVGDQARVIYHNAVEDPAATMAAFTERIEVLADGTLKQITVRLWSSPEDSA